MANDVKQLEKCVKRCAPDDVACRDACYAAYAGKVEGGKVFTDPTGDTIVVTDGGKVFKATT